MERGTKRWSAREDGILRENYKRVLVPALAEQLGRSPKATRSRLERLGLRLAGLGRNYRAWTKAEVQLLRQNIQKPLRTLCAMLPSRSEGAIYNQARALGRKTRYVGWHLMRGRKFISIGRGKTMAEHRLIVERRLGRKLASHEQVHHVNIDYTDNRDGNLYLCHDASHHRQLHASLERLVKPLMERGVIKFDNNKGRYEL